VSSRFVRLIVVPALLFVVVSAAVFGLAKWHPAKRGDGASTVVTGPGDLERGRGLFAEKCAVCHGERGEGGGVGPRLVGSDLSLGQARATIENGSGVMPADLVAGQELEDVLVYLEFVFTT